MSNATAFDYYDINTNEGLSDNELHERYDEMLDEVYGEFMNLLASDILKSTDPIAYRVGFSDWIDGELYETITDEAPADDDE